MRIMTAAMLAALAVPLALTASPAGANGVSAGVAGAVTATGHEFFRPTHGLVLSATCTFSVVGTLDGDLHVQATGVAVAVAHRPVSSSSVTCTVYAPQGYDGSRSASAAGPVAVLEPTITLAGQAPFRICVSASAVGTVPVAVTIPETCSVAVIS